MESSTQTSVFQIINTSSKGLWPPSENVTLVQASSREAIIQAILRGQDTFIEKRLTPRVGIYTSFGPSIPVYTCIYTDTRIYGLNTYDD